MRTPGLAAGVYCLVGSGVDLERWARGLKLAGSEERFCLRLWGRPPSDTNERIELVEVQRLSLRDGEDSIDDIRERGGEP
jgi:hypothetical protein